MTDAAKASEKALVCRVCSKVFQKAARLKRHETIHDAQRPVFVCKVPGCEKVYHRRDHLKRHESTHESAKRHTCPVAGCGRSFFYRYHLTRHHLAVHGSPQDGAASKRQCVALAAEATESVIQSIRASLPEGVAPGGSALPAGVQGVIDSIRASIPQGAASGDGAPPAGEGAAPAPRSLGFLCGYPGCGKAFGSGAELRAHVKDAHGSAKVFVCPVEGCGKRYSRKSNCRAHVREAHGPPRYFCPEPGCLAKYRQKQGLKRHVARAHGLPGGGAVAVPCKASPPATVPEEGKSAPATVAMEKVSPAAAAPKAAKVSETCV